MRQRFLTFVVFGLVLVILAEWNLRARKLAPIQSLNQFWLEFCVGNAGDKIDDPAVTIVRINDDYEPLSIGADSPASPDGKLSRLDFATILGFIAKMNPKAVTFLPTPTFDEKLVLNQTDIVPLKDAAMQLPRLVTAANVSNDGEQATDSKPLAFPEIKLEGSPEDLLRFTRTVRHPDPQILANADPAFKSIESARGLYEDGVIRVPLVASHRGKVVPSVVLASVALHAGIPLNEIVLDLDSNPPVIRLGEFRTVPVLSDGTFVLPQKAGVRRGMSSLSPQEDGEMKKIEHFTSLTVDELAYTGEKEDEVAQRILASFEGKFDSLSENLVVVGFDRTGDRRIESEVGAMVSETSVLARTMATIQSGRFIEWWPMWMRWFAILAIGAIAAFLFRFPKSKIVPVWGISFLLFFGISVLIFRQTLSWTPPFFAFGLFGLMLLIGLTISKDTKPNVETSE